MIRHILLICILVFSVAISGCERSHPGNYPQPEVEAQVKKSLKLTEIQITADPAGGYSGIGKTGDGESFKVDFDGVAGFCISISTLTPQAPVILGAR